MAEVLYAPSREQVVTTNAWAFLHWLRMGRGLVLKGWAALQAWSAREPAEFAAALGEFAGMGRVLPCRERRGGFMFPADELLFADLRPDDTLLVIRASLPDPLGRAARERASVLIAPASLLATAAFARPGRPDLADLRTIIATGGPMSPEARRRIYTWVKADVLLLAHAGDTYWGNPLEPVLAQPPATPAFVTPRPSAPPPR